MAIDYRVGDVFARMADIPDGSVSLVASSPPFIALRSYLPADHPDKALEIGSEPDPATFLDTLLRLTAEWGRVLAPWGSIAIELGDTYAGSGGGDAALSFRMAINGERDKAGKTDRRILTGWPRAKCLALIPQLYATSLAYGRNLLTGEPSPAGQWLVRNVIVWHRPNPAVGALGDKVRPSTSYITVATRSKDRWFDLTAVRTPSVNPIGVGARPTQARVNGADAGDGRGSLGAYTVDMQTAGAPPLDCWFDQHDTWTLTTSPSKLAHFAMWPPRLAERLILMMCPEWVCATCGQPRRRIEKHSERYAEIRGRAVDLPVTSWDHDSTPGGRGTRASLARQTMKDGTRFTAAEYETLGWSSCGHDNYQPGVVLDPFAGTGTSLAVAELHHRDSIGIDLDNRNRDLLPRRTDECKRVLYGTQPELPGQQDLFAEAAS